MNGKPNLKDLVLEMVDHARECNKRRLEIEKHYDGIEIGRGFDVRPFTEDQIKFFLLAGLDKLAEELELPIEEDFIEMGREKVLTAHIDGATFKQIVYTDEEVEA